MVGIGEKLTFLPLPWSAFLVWTATPEAVETARARAIQAENDRKPVPRKSPKKGNHFEKNIQHLPVPWILRRYVSFFFQGRLFFSEACEYFLPGFLNFSCGDGSTTSAHLEDKSSSHLGCIPNRHVERVGFQGSVSWRKHLVLKAGVDLAPEAPAAVDIQALKTGCVGS